MKAINISAIYTIWLREMKKYIRNRSRIVGNIVIPFFFLAFLGMGLDAMITPGMFGGMDYLDFMAPGVIAMTLLFSSIFTGVSILWDREFGFLKEILVAPVSRVSIVIGKVIAGMTTGTMQALIILAISIGIGVKITGLAGVLTSIIFILLVSMAFVSLGIAFASKMKDMQGFQIIMSFIIMPIWILSGAFFPLEGTPFWIYTLSVIDPLTYGVDGLRASLVGISAMPILLDAAVLLAFSATMITLSAWLFSKTEV